GASLAGLFEIVQRDAGRVEDRVVGRHPGERVGARRIGRERLEQIIGLIAVNLIEADEAVGLAVGAGDVACGKYLQAALAVTSADFLLQGLQLGGQVRIARDQLLGEIKIVAGLLFVIGEDEAIAALRALADHQNVEAGEYEIGSLPIFLAAT